MVAGEAHSRVFGDVQNARDAALPPATVFGSDRDQSSTKAGRLQNTGEG